MSDTTPYQVPKEPGRWRALTLAVAVHIALLAFLYIGIRWQSQTPAAVEAEVWSTQAREAAPKPQPEAQPQPKPEPKPEPKPDVKAPPKVEPKPDIALEQEKKKLAEQKERDRLEKVAAEIKARRLAEAEAAKKAAAEKQKQSAEAKRAEQRRQEELQRMLAGAGGSGEAPKAQGGRADPDYVGRLVAKIRSNTVFIEPPGMSGNPAVEYRVDLLPDGSIRSIRKLRASGLSNFDEKVEQGVLASAPFPPDKSGKVPSYFTFSHKPRNE